MTSITFKEHLVQAPIEEIQGILEKATVTHGHLNGKHIHLAGYEGHCTFTDLSRRIDACYREALQPMVNTVCYDRWIHNQLPEKRIAGKPAENDYRHCRSYLMSAYAVISTLMSSVVNDVTKSAAKVVYTGVKASEEELQLYQNTIDQRDLCHKKLKEIDQNTDSNIWDSVCSFFGSRRWKRSHFEEDQQDLNWLRAEVSKEPATTSPVATEEESTFWLEIAKATHGVIGEYIKQGEKLQTPAA